jgi:hypothetical protein
VAKRYQVFVSSTLDDLREERRKVWETLISFDYIVVGMETFPATNDEQFEFIKKQILGSDYYVLVIGARYGSVTDSGISFTEREYLFAVEHGIPVLVFPVRDPESLAVSKTDKDQAKAKKLANFRKRATAKRLVHLWEKVDDLCLGIVKALRTAESNHPRVGWVRGDSPTDHEVLQELRNLQSENKKLRLKAEEARKPGTASLLDLNKSIEIEYALTAEPNEKRMATVSIKAIVSEFRLTEGVDEGVVDECIRGAVSVLIGGKYEEVNVEVNEVERVMLMLAAQDIVRLRPGISAVSVEHGGNWLAANAGAKLG